MNIMEDEDSITAKVDVVKTTLETYLNDAGLTTLENLVARMFTYHTFAFTGILLLII